MKVLQLIDVTSVLSDVVIVNAMSKEVLFEGATHEVYERAELHAKEVTEVRGGRDGIVLIEIEGGETS